MKFYRLAEKQNCPAFGLLNFGIKCLFVLRVKILHRYIFVECLIFSALSLCIFTGILFTVQLLRFSDLIINRGVDAGQIGSVFLALIPTFLELALPMSVLLGIMLAFARLSGDSEIVVLKSSGISLYQLLLPVLLFSLAALVTALAVSMYLKPWGFRTLEVTLFEIAKSQSTAGLDEGTFNRLGNLTLYAEGIDYSTGGLSRVLVDDRRDDAQRKVIFAKSGEITSDAENRTISIHLKDGVMHELVSGKYGLTNFQLNSVTLTPDELYGSDKDGDKPPRSLYLSELREGIRHENEVIADIKANPEIKPEMPLSEAIAAGLLAPEIIKGIESPTLKSLERRQRRMRFELGSRFSMPMAAALLAFIAVPLGVQPPRAQKTWGPTLSFLVGLMVFVIYYGLLSIGMAVADGGKLSPAIVCWLPNLVVAILGAVAIWAVASERVQSFPELVGALWRKIPIRKRAAA